MIKGFIGIVIGLIANSSAVALADCVAIQDEFNEAEMDMADARAENTYRAPENAAVISELKLANAYHRYQVALDLARANSCLLPKSPPKSYAYFRNALACRIATFKDMKPGSSEAELKNQLSEADKVCDRSKWRRFARPDNG